jgi:hypothetical protein
VSDDSRPSRRAAPRPSGSEGKFLPKIPPSDYQQFIFKCHDCQLGFKRRGMLINHLAKRHPDIAISSVPELNLPILKSTRDFYCQYCNKVYKSSAKRKMHILKSHPGAELPASARNQPDNADASSSLPNPTFSTTVGSMIVTAHACNSCHKQYASKAKLLQHQRKKHGSQWDAAGRRRAGPMAVAPRVVSDGTGDHQLMIDTSSDGASKLLTAAMLSRCLSEGAEIQIIQHGAAGLELSDADLLTQAVNELTQSFGTEYRLVTTGGVATPSDFQNLMPCIVNVPSGAALLQSISTSTSQQLVDQLAGTSSSNLIVPQGRAGGAVIVGGLPRGGPGQAQILHTMPRSIVTSASTVYTPMQQQQQQRASVNVNWNVVTANNNFQNF